MLFDKIGGGDPPFFMISSTTPDKLRWIIQDTWPQLFRYEPPKEKTEPKEDEDVHP